MSKRRSTFEDDHEGLFWLLIAAVFLVIFGILGVFMWALVRIVLHFT